MLQGSTALEQVQKGQLWKDAASIQAFSGELPTSRLRLYIDFFADDFEQGYPQAVRLASPALLRPYEGHMVELGELCDDTALHYRIATQPHSRSHLAAVGVDDSLIEISRLLCYPRRIIVEICA